MKPDEVCRITEVSLLDRFAMAALQGDWATQTHQFQTFSAATSDNDLLLAARLYYRMAEAMMQIRYEKDEQERPNLNLWSDEQVAELKRRGIITIEEPEQLEQERKALRDLLAAPVSDLDKFKRCKYCGVEILIEESQCDNCIPF